MGTGAETAVEVLIPNFNRKAALRRTLRSLVQQTMPASVCVVDNGSSDGSTDMIAREFPDVRTIALPSNLGFGAALNRGVESSAADHLVFLNNDAVADERFIEEIMAVLHTTRAEAVAACLRRPDGTIDSLGVEIDRSLIAYDIGHGMPYPGPALRELELLGPTGGAALYSRDAFLGLGGFDERFFAYLEDVDLAIRLREAGGSCALGWRAFAWHEHSATLGSGTAAKNRLMGRARGLLLQKHGARLTARDRLRGHAIDGVVYLGQAAIDRNIGAFRGRAESRRSSPRTRAEPGLAAIPVTDLSLRGSLSRRLGRRYRSA